MITSPGTGAHRRAPSKAESIDRQPDAVRSRSRTFDSRTVDVRGSTYKPATNMGFQSGPTRDSYRANYPVWRPDHEAYSSFAYDRTSQSTGPPGANWDIMPKRTDLPQLSPLADREPDPPRGNTSNYLPPPREFTRPGFANSAETPRAPSSVTSGRSESIQTRYAAPFQPDHQHRLPRLESLSRDMSHSSDPERSSIRPCEQHSTATYTGPITHHAQHLKRLSSHSEQEQEQSRAQAPYQKRDDNHSQRAAMGIKSLLQASEQLEDGVGPSDAAPGTSPKEYGGRDTYDYSEK